MVIVQFYSFQAVSINQFLLQVEVGNYERKLYKSRQVRIASIAECEIFIK